MLDDFGDGMNWIYAGILGEAEILHMVEQSTMVVTVK